MLLATAAAVGAAVLSGCGGSSNANTSTVSNIAREKARAQFETCLRQHGVNINQAGGGNVRIQVGGPKDTPAFQSAFNACRGYLKGTFESITPAQRAQFRQAAVKFTSCLRAHGINVPDPTFNDSGPGSGPQTATGVGVRQAFGGVDRNTPAFQAAAKTCQSLLPKPPGGAVRIGGGPGGPPGPPLAGGNSVGK